MNKIFIVVLLVLLQYPVFAEVLPHTKTEQETPRNTVYGGLSFVPIPHILFFLTSISVGYERSLNNRFSASLNIGADAFMDPFMEIRGLWYPWQRAFFVGLGTGISWHINRYMFIPPSHLFTFNLGWKINIGRQQKWVLIPNITEGIAIDYSRNLIGSFTRVKLSVGYRF